MFKIRAWGGIDASSACSLGLSANFKRRYPIRTHYCPPDEPLGSSARIRSVPALGGIRKSRDGYRPYPRVHVVQVDLVTNKSSHFLGGIALYIPL